MAKEIIQGECYLKKSTKEILLCRYVYRGCGRNGKKIAHNVKRVVFEPALKYGKTVNMEGRRVDFSDFVRLGVLRNKKTNGMSRDVFVTENQEIFLSDVLQSI